MVDKDDALLSELLSLGDSPSVPSEAPTDFPDMGSQPASPVAPMAPVEPPLGGMPLPTTAGGVIETAVGEKGARDTLSEIGAIFGQARRKVRGFIGLPEEGEDPSPLELMNPAARLMAEYGVQKTQEGGFGEMGKSLVRGFTGAKKMVGEGIEQYGKTLDNEAVSEFGAHTSKEGAAVAENPLLAPRIATFRDIRSEAWIGDTADYLTSKLGEGVGNIAGIAAFYQAGGAAGAAGFLATMSIGEVREGLKEAGITDEAKIAPYAYSAGLAIAALEAVFPAHVLKELTAPAKRAIAEHVARTVVKGAWGGMWREGITEGLQEATQIAAVAHAKDAVSFFDSKPVLDALSSGENIDRIIEAVISGAVPGTVIGGVTSGAQVRRAPRPGTDTEEKQEVSTETGVETVRDVSPSLDPNVDSGRAGGIRVPRAPDPVIDEARAVIDGLAPAQPAAAAPAAPAQIPTFAQVLDVLPKDEAGDPDIGLMMEGLSEFGAKAWGGLTPEQKTTLFRRFAPVVEQAAAEAGPVVEKIAEAVASGDIAGAVQQAAEAISQSPYEQYRARRTQLQDAASEASKALQQFPRMPDGRRSDEVKFSPEFRAAKTAYDQAVAQLGALNKQNKEFDKQYQRDYVRERDERRAAIIAAQPQPAAPVRTESELRAAFDKVLSSKTKRSDWASAVGIEQAQLDTFIKEALKDGRLKKTKAGAIVRTGKKVALPAPVDQPAPVVPVKTAPPRPPTLDRASEVRLDAVKSDVARRYAQRLIEAGNDLDAVEAAIRAMQQNKKVGKGALAEIVRAYGGVRGKPKSVRAAYSMIRSIAAERTSKGATNADSQPVREDAGLVPEGGIPAGVPADEALGELAEAPATGGDGSPGPVGDAGSANEQQPGPAGELLGAGEGSRSDPGTGPGDGATRPDTGAATEVETGNVTGVSEDELQAIREQIAADKAREAIEREERSRRNYRITDEDAIGSGGPKAKVRANLEAIETLKAIEAENRPATEDEKKILVKYVGWGAFSQDVFATHKPEWAKERSRLQNLLSPEDYAAARASTINAHYTSPDVIKGMWSALEHMGFKGGRVLEPAAGIGHFIGLQPEAMREASQWTAVELDTTSARITKALYGAADVRAGGFEAQVWPDDHFDLAISNVPFDKTGPYDPRYKTNFSLHDYFFVKALDKVRPGGIVAFITSSYSMDKERDVARREMEKRGTFLGAIRLPGGNQGAFKANAGTDVTTDIIFFRKRLSGEPTETNSEWRDLVEIKTPDKTPQNPTGTTKINGYFAANPDMMLGKMRLIGSMYSKGEPVLIGPTANLDERIAEVAQNLPANAMLPAETSGAALAQDIDTDTDGIKEGAFYEKDGAIYRKIIGVGQPQKLNKANADRVRMFMGVRDIVDELFAIQGGKEAVAGRKEALRAALNESYDAFVEKFGPINLTNVTERVDKAGRTITTRRKPNFAAFEEDPSAYKVAMIEVYDEKTGTARKAAIMSEDVIGSYQRPRITGSTDALTVSLNEVGRVDMGLIAEQMGVSQEEAAALLGDTVFLNPKGEQWQTATQYLAGDVVQKLADAKAAVALDGGERYQRNVEALEKVQPDPLTRVEITIPFGASWVPIEVYNEFVEEVLGVKGIRIDLNETTKQWRVLGTTSRTFGENAADAEWATDRKSMGAILEATLNSKPIEIYDEKRTATGETERVRNIEAEELARAKGTRMREAFSGQIFPGAQAAIGGWVWENEERAQRLESLYNQTFNRIVKEQHDGSHLTFPGLAKVVSFPDGSTGTINLTPARVNAIWRIIQNGNTLIDHVVGAGKTWTSIMAVMEMKRLGQIRRPMFVVPNHMLHQFSHEFLQAYPAAKLLVADKDSMSAAKRKEFAAKAAAEKWDGIIITHSAFTRLRMQDKAYQDYYAEAIAEMKEAKDQAAREEGVRSPTVKDIEKATKSLQAKLDKLTKKEKKDEGVTFEELGVDHLTVDEAHKFKKLWFQTRHNRVRGIPKQESQRATDLYIKIRHLEKSRPGRSALFLTGTPLSNSMAEVYVMMKYLQHDTLEEYGIEKFDAWAQTFGLIDSKTELAPNGRDFRDASSFSKFVNIPELSTLYGRIADTQTAESLKLPRPALKGGKPVLVKSKLSDGEEKFVQDLIQAMEKLKGKKPEKGDPNFLSLFTQGLQVGTDFRLIDPSAPANPDGKIAKAVENISRIWKDGNADPAAPNKAQLVFLDMGVPGSKGKASVGLPSSTSGMTGDVLADDIEALRKKLADEYEAKEVAEETDGTDDAAEGETETASEDALAKAMLVGKFNLYADLKTKLVAAGIPAEQIAFIHDAKDDNQKAKLFEKVRNGDVRILLGSSEKMGVGTNVQKRLVAMHHIDAPWTPADVEQRDGRILRQGNLNKEVEIYRYITERSFDSYRWQILETKSNFIAQFRAGARGVRIAEEIDAPLPEAADLKAAATGDPRIIEHAEVTRQVRSLQAQASAHAGSARRAAGQLVHTRADLAQAQRFVEPYAMDALRVTDLSGDNFKIQVERRGGGKTEVTKRKQAGEALRAYILSLAENAWYARENEIEFGTISGFDLSGTVRKTPDGTEVVASIKGAETYSTGKWGSFLINAETDPVQLIRKWETLVREMPSYHETVVARIAQYEAEIPKLEAIAKGSAFPKQAELERAMQRQSDLEKALMSAPPGSPQAAPVIEEDGKALQDIVNPIDSNASPDEKLRQIAALTAVNKPILDAQLKAMDAALGTTSNANIKKPETILSKASRPSILAEKPWHGVEHIRDTLRFQTKISRFEQIEQAAEAMLAQGYSIVKIDTKKMLAPKEWGWRFAGFDLRAPNGQLIEWYIIFDTMYVAKKEGHLIFEKWRNETDEAKQERAQEYEADIQKSYALYKRAFETGLQNSGYSDLEAASADINKLSASLPVTAAKLAATSSGLGSGVAMPSLTGTQSASAPGLNSPPTGSPITQALPEPSSAARTKGSFSGIGFTSSSNPNYIGSLPGQNNLGATEGRVTPALPDSEGGVQAAIRSADEIAKATRAYQFIRKQVLAGKRVPISEDVTNAFLDAAWPHSDLVPSGAQVAALSALRPPTAAEKVVSPWADVVGEFRSLDGTILTTALSLDKIDGYRGGYDRRNGAIVFFGLSRADVDGLTETVVRSRVAHEAVHAVWKSLPRSAKSRLVRHANVLGVLDMQLGTVLQAVGERRIGNRQEQETLRDLYAKQYAGDFDAKDRIDQESVAHMRELAAAGFFMDAELSAISADMALLDNVQEGVSPEERPMALQAAIQSSQDRASLADHFGATRIEDIGPNDPHPGRVLAFHGTGVAFDRMDPEKTSFGVHFGTGDQANYVIDAVDNRAPRRVYPAVIDIRNPVTLPDIGTWGEHQVALELQDIDPVRFGGLGDLVLKIWKDGNNSDYASDLAKETVRIAMEDAGYDAIRYYNRFEGEGWSYIVWEPGKVISATAGTPLFALSGGLPSDLDMSPEARKARAREMGFDTDNVWLHGTTKPGFDAFDNARLGDATGASNTALGHFFTNEPDLADLYSGRRGAIVPTYLRLRKPYEIRANPDGLDGPDPSAAINETVAKDVGKRISQLTQDDFAAWREELQARGYDGVTVTLADGSNEPIRSAVVFDPSNIRSVNADFDPSQSDSSNLMFALSGGLPRDGEVAGARPSIDPGEIKRFLGKAEYDYQLSPAAVVEPDPYGGFSEMAANLPDDVNARFQVHGMTATQNMARGVAGDLIDLLENGIDPSRGFNSGPPKGGTFGVDTTRTNAPFLILSEPGKMIPETGIKYVVLNGPAAALKFKLSVAYPGVDFLTVTEADQFMRTGALPPKSTMQVGARQPTPPGIAKTAEADADEGGASPSLNAVIQKLKESLNVVPTQTLLGVTIKAEDGSQVRLNPRKNVRGQMVASNAAVGVRKSRQIDVIAHEMAHTLEVTLGADILDFQQQNAAMLEAFAPGLTPSEQFADWFSYYITSGPGARAITPSLVGAFEDVIEANAPEMLEGIHEAQALYSDWLARSTPDELASDVVSTYAGNSWTDLAGGDRSLSETIPGKMAGAYTAIIDDLSPVQHMVRRLLQTADRNGVTDEAGRPISLAVADNPYKIARMFRGSYATGYSWLKSGIANQGETSVAFPGLSKALETLFGSSDQGAWDQTMYQTAGNYLIAQRAVAEYERMEEKESRLADIDSLIERGGAAGSQARSERGRLQAILERREDARLRSEALMRDRRTALQRAEREVARLQERIQAKKDDVLAAQMARDGALASRRQRDLANLERSSQAALRAASGLLEEFETLSTDVSLLSAEIAQRSEQIGAMDQQIAQIDGAVGNLRRERDATAKRGASRPPTKESKQHWLEVIAKTEADPKYARIQPFADEVHQFAHGLLTIRHQAGLVSDEQFQELSKRRNWYVPFQRDMSDASPETVFGGAATKKWSPFKKFDGSDRAIINPLETLASDAYATAQQIAFNDAVNALAGLAERAGPGSASIAQVLTREESAEANETTFKRIKDIALGMGLEEADADRIVHQMEQNFAGQELSLMWSPATKGPVNLPTVPLWRNGERVLVRLTDPEFGTEAFNALSGLGKEMSDWAINFLAVPARLLQMGITTHPTFLPRNLFRDIFDAWIKTGALPVVTQVKGAMAMRDPEFLRRYYEAGGIVGGRNVAALTSKEQQYKVLDLADRRISRGSIMLGAVGGGLLGTLYGGPIGGVIGAAVGGYALRKGEVLKAVEAVETMTRVGVATHAYKRAMEHNPDLTESEAMLEAAFVARDTFDWNRRGSKMLTLTRLVTFLNAQIQGMDAAARKLGGESDRGMMLSRHLGMVWRRENGATLSADEERMLGEAYKTWARVGLYTAGLVTLYALATSGDDEDDKKYQDIRDKTKATHSWLPNIFGVDVRLPKAFEWAVPANVIEAIVDKVRGRDPRMWDRIVDSTYEVMAPPLVPQAMTLIVGLTTNAQMEQLAPWVKRLLGRSEENATNRQVVGDNLARLDPESQFDAFTSQLSIDIAKGMAASGVPRDLVPSPKKIDFILRSGGYWGQDIAKGYGIVREGLGFRGREAPRVSDLPVVAGFTGVAARQSKSRDELFGLMAQSGGRLATAAATYKQLIDEEGTPADAERFISRLDPEERVYALLKYYGAPQMIKDHPLERLLSVDRVLSRVRKDIILDRLTPVSKQGRKTVRDFEEKITLSPRKQTEIHEIIERLQQAEAWNSMIVMNRPGWEGKKEIATKPILDELKASSKAVFDLYEDRMQATRAREFSDVKQDWPELRGRILRDGLNAF